MWKNSGGNTLMKGVYSEFLIKGYNLDRFLNFVKKRGICVYDVKKFKQNEMKVSVKYRQSKIFFAIAEELCYNITKIKDKGRFYPFLYLYKNLGLVIGSLILLTLAILSNDFIFRVDYVGTGSVLKYDVEQQLEERGITKFSRFSSTDLDDLSTKLLSLNPRLTFVECSKEGNVLIVNSVLSEGSKDKLTGKATQLVSDCDGIIEDLKIYRGSAKVKIGDEIKAGQIIVDGIVTVKDQELSVNVLAVAYIKCKAVYEYSSSIEGLENAVLSLYEENFDEGEVIDSHVLTSQTENGYLYQIEIYYRRIVSVG